MHFERGGLNNVSCNSDEDVNVDGHDNDLDDDCGILAYGSVDLNCFPDNSDDNDYSNYDLYRTMIMIKIQEMICPLIMMVMMVILLCCWS